MYVKKLDEWDLCRRLRENAIFVRLCETLRTLVCCNSSTPAGTVLVVILSDPPDYFEHAIPVLVALPAST